MPPVRTFRLPLAAAAALALLWIAIPPAAEPHDGFRPEKAGFSVQFKEEISPYRVMALFALPNQAITVRALHEDEGKAFTLKAVKGKVYQTAPRAWKWSAPSKPGVYPLAVTDLSTAETVTLNAFVMVPFDRLEKECVNGYRIGAYPSCPPNTNLSEPEGFIEVTQANGEVLLSPHFRLKQFLCKQKGEREAKYLVLRERLILKLEILLEEVNRRGIRADTFHVMSGYRTPAYNKAIGNVKFSRHLWGEAADIFIDHNGDGMMDDINGDGKVDKKDAMLLAEIIADLADHDWYLPYVGGLGAYAKSAVHGPFVHVDVRGTKARWGLAVQTAAGKKP